MNSTGLVVPDLFSDPVLVRPREVLTGSQITHLRKLDQFGCAMKARGGWMCGGTWYRLDTFRQFVAKNLADEDFSGGKHKILLNARGRTVLALLQPKRAVKPAALAPTRQAATKAPF